MLINFQLLDHQVLVRHTNDIRGDGSSQFDQYMLSIALWVALISVWIVTRLYVLKEVYGNIHVKKTYLN